MPPVHRDGLHCCRGLHTDEGPSDAKGPFPMADGRRGVPPFLTQGMASGSTRCRQPVRPKVSLAVGFSSPSGGRRSGR